MYEDFNLTDYRFRLSYRDPEDKHKYFDNDEMWENAQTMLRAALDEMGVDYFEAEGEAAFYGPKIGYPGEDCPWKRRNPLHYPA